MKNFKKGMLFTSIGVYSNFIVQFIVNVVLSRLLTPKEFGVVAIMQVFILFFSLMIESGMGPAIIQNKTLTMEDERVLYNYSAIFAFLIASLFGLFGFILSYIYNNEIYQTITWIQAISVFFNGLNIVPTALLNKNKLFKEVNISLILGNVLAAIVGVTSALLGIGIYALIFSAIVSSLINFLLNRSHTKLRFISNLSIEPLKKVWNFSRNQFGFNLINYFSRNSDNILIGKFMGVAPLANYNKAYQLLLMPTQLLANIINPVLQPILSDYQDDVTYIKKVYLKLVHIMILIGLPLSIFLSLSAKQIIYFVFGTQWTLAILPFSILALTVWIQLAISSTGAILQSRNNSKLLLINGVLSALILVSSIVLGVVLGSITTVAICYSLGAFLVFFINFYNVIVNSLEEKYIVFLKEFISPVILAFLVFLTLSFENMIDPTNVSMSLLIRGVIFLGVFILYVYLTPEKEIVMELLGKSSNKGKASASHKSVEYEGLLVTPIEQLSELLDGTVGPRLLRSRLYKNMEFLYSKLEILIDKPEIVSYNSELISRQLLDFSVILDDIIKRLDSFGEQEILCSISREIMELSEQIYNLSIYQGSVEEFSQLLNQKIIG